MLLLHSMEHFESSSIGDNKTFNSFDYNVEHINVAIESFSSKRPPLCDQEDISKVPCYVLTGIDEHTRNFCSYTSAIQDRQVATVCYNPKSKGIKFNELEEYQPLKFASIVKSQPISGLSPTSNSSDMDCPSSNIIKHYHPGYLPWISPHTRSPSELQCLLTDRPTTDTYLFLRLLSCGPKQFYEPLFGSVSLYKVLPDGQIAKINENFHFDFTPSEIRKDYGSVYGYDVTSSSNSKATGSESVGNSEFNPITNCKSCLFTIPNDLRDQNIYAIFQLSKVLTCDGDKACSPYIKGNSGTLQPNEYTKHKDSCQRLSQYRQQIGVCAIKVFDKQWRVGQFGSPTVAAPFHALKSGGITDTLIGQVSLLI